MAAATGRLINRTTGETLLEHTLWCASFGCKLRGLMFRKTLPDDEGLLFVEKSSSRVDTAIHMLFMSFPIAAIWLDDDFRVVDKTHAAPWRLVYAPKQPARYTLEANPYLLDRVTVGDELAFEPSNPE